jgi:hypothetical protein
VQQYGNNNYVKAFGEGESTKTKMFSNVTESGEQQVPRMHHRHRTSQSQNQGHHEDHQILLKPTTAICDDHGFKSSESEDESSADSES